MHLVIANAVNMTPPSPPLSNFMSASIGKWQRYKTECRRWLNALDDLVNGGFEVVVGELDDVQPLLKQPKCC